MDKGMIWAGNGEKLAKHKQRSPRQAVTDEYTLNYSEWISQSKRIWFSTVEHHVASICFEMVEKPILRYFAKIAQQSQ